MKIIIALIGVPLGFWLARYRVKVVDSFGKMTWAERYLGTGGSYTVWVIIGTAMVIGSILNLFGLLPFVS